MFENNLLSIIVPVYNVEKYVDRCIESLVNQTYLNKEIIIVDDGSLDGSGKKCDVWKDRFPYIKVIHKTNGGLSSARNVGLNNANGTYVGFVDSDDYVSSDMYEKIIDFMVENNVDVAVCGRNNVYENGELIEGLCPDIDEVIDTEKAISNVLTWNGMDTSVCDKCFKRNLWENIRFPEGEIGEDTAVFLQIFEKTTRIGLLCERLYYYYQRSGSISKKQFTIESMDIIKHADQIYNYIMKNHPKCMKAAAYFRSVETEALLDMIFALDYDIQKQYNEEVGSLKKRLRSMTKYWIREKRIGKRRKWKYICWLLR